MPPARTNTTKAKTTPYTREGTSSGTATTSASTSTSASAASESDYAPSTKSAAEPKPKTTTKRAPKAYTPSEEKIFKALALDTLHEHLWAKVKADGRLAGRGSTGIKAHIRAVFGKSDKK